MRMCWFVNEKVKECVVFLLEYMTTFNMYMIDECRLATMGSTTGGENYFPDFQETCKVHDTKLGFWLL